MDGFIKLGSHSPNLSGALLQMSNGPYAHGKQQAHILDVSRAIAEIHAELALLRTEATLLRVAVAAQIDLSASLVGQVNQMITLSVEQSTARVESLTRLEESLADEFGQRYETTRRAAAEHMDTVSTHMDTISAQFAAASKSAIVQSMEDSAALADAVRVLTSEIQQIPETYFWPRFKRWMRRLRNAI